MGWAPRHGTANQEVVEALLDAGATTQLTDYEYSQTHLDLAMTEKHAVVFTLLE